MGQAPIVDSADGEVWKMDKTVQEVKKNFSSTDLTLLIKETAKDETLVETLILLRKTISRFDDIPEDYRMFKKKLSTRFGLVFFEDNIILPRGLRTTVITLLHKGHLASYKMQLSAKGLWWPRISESIQRNCEECVPVQLQVKILNQIFLKPKINHLPKLSEPNEEINWISSDQSNLSTRHFTYSLAMDRYSKWPTASLCKSTNGNTVKNFMILIYNGTRYSKNYQNG